MVDSVTTVMSGRITSIEKTGDTGASAVNQIPKIGKRRTINHISQDFSYATITYKGDSCYDR
ncbi:hypothetical protein HI914_03235 [Erysiphe necator]|nr:hypothetical protein HI914_03235 [Erysiphe necator]